MALIQSLITSDRYGIKCPYSITPKGICIHNTANDASARNEIEYMKNNNAEVSFHIAVDDVESIQGLPLNRNAWHSGDGSTGEGNRNYIAIEICYSLSGGERFIKAEQRTAKEVAALLKQYGWGIDRVKKHQDFSGKYCPHRTLDMGWQRFLNMIQAELNGPGTTPGDITTGSKVKIVGINYATGQIIPNWVKQNTYTVQKINGDKALIQEIISWVYLKDLKLISEDNSQPSPGPINRGDEYEQKRYSETGVCHITADCINFRNKPIVSDTNPITGQYYKGESVKYDLVVITNKYVWISWVSVSTGERRYMPITDKTTKEKWAYCV